MPSSPPRKAFYPLESNPLVFNELLLHLGVSPGLQFQDIFTLSEPDFLPHHPALALILVFPADEVLKADAASARPAYAGYGADEPVVWFRQTIQNACGLYALLHGVCNGAAGRFIEPDGLLARLLKESIPLAPEGRAKVLENSAELERAHTAVALTGDSAVPESADAEVEFHYICYVKSGKDGRVYELDGDRKGPIDTGVVLEEDGEDVCCEKVLGLVRRYIEGAEGNMNFGLLVLVDEGGGMGEGARTS